MEEKMTMKEFKKLFDDAKERILIEPTKGLKKVDEDKKAEIDFTLMLNGLLLFHQLEEELFGEEKENE